jgi:pheromone receptor transcription factor
MLLVASETGHVYTFATRKLQPMITSEAGKALIQTCLNSPDPPGAGTDPQRMSATGYEETELTYAADPNASDHGDTKVRLSSPYSAQGPPPGMGGPGLHHSPSVYGSPLNNNYHSSPGMMFPHSPSPNSNVLYHYPSEPQPPQCYAGGMHSPTNSPHLAHLTR